MENEQATVEAVVVGQILAIDPTSIILDGDWAADSEMVNSILARGQRVPVDVENLGDGANYLLRDGRRRLAAIRHINEKLGGNLMVEVIVVDDKEVTGDEWKWARPADILAENLHQRNRLSNARAIVELVGAGKDVRYIREVSGLNASEQKLAASLTRLIPAFQKMVERREMSVTTALRLARHDPDEQAVIWKLACGKQERADRLPSARMVDDAARERRASRQPALPDLAAMPVNVRRIEHDEVDYAALAGALRKTALNNSTDEEREKLLQAAVCLERKA